MPILFLIFITSLAAGCRENASPSNAALTPTSPPAAQVSVEEPTPQPTQETGAPQVELSPKSGALVELMQILGNLSYAGLFSDQQISLIDGYAYYEDPPGRPYIRLIDRLIVSGDLDEDGAEDALVILVDDTVGSGDFVYLAAVMDVWGDPAPVEALMVGDRSPVKSLEMDGSQVVVELIGPGPGDPSCCPSWNLRQVFGLEDGKLVELSSAALQKASLDDLSGTGWRLVDFNIDQQPVLTETEISLSFEAGQISGSAGCNTYNGMVTGDENIASEFLVGPLATTRMSCDEAIMQQEVTYLNLLAKVTSWRYNFGNLGLVYKLDNGDFGELLFSPQSP